ncbi:hypothetical protein F5Y04DRAFT_249567 [Hypomontagnella monticulosa]|nr:hypothetical protein F5Y04DRAFT_249567 [Hypomontagnella monticulosa]
MALGLNTIGLRLRRLGGRIERQHQGEGGLLTVLVGPREPNVDIVAIHGLNPFDTPNHSEATWTASERLWLRDFLPTQVPNARIFLFGYNSNVVFNTAAAGVRNQAKNILAGLAQHRKGNLNRPLVFICHSLGGLIVKKALVLSAIDRKYEPILRSTHGIVFFGTPHNGGNYAGVGSIISNIGRSLLGNPSNDFINALSRNSHVLVAITDDFRHLSEQLQFICFYETLPLGRFGIIVDQHSATLGFSGIRETDIALEADHNSMCKFSDGADLTYGLVEGYIVDMIDEACSSLRQRVAGHQNMWDQDGEGNTVRLIGDRNDVSQSGDGNTARVRGKESRIKQVTHSDGPEILDFI